MNAPTNVTRASVEALLTHYYLARCIPGDLGGYRCKACGLPIYYTTAYMSVHTFPGLCAGEGRVVTLPLPYCLRCEGEPIQYGCVHVPEQTPARATMGESIRSYFASAFRVLRKDGA